VSICKRPVTEFPISPGVAEMDLMAPGTFDFEGAFWWICRVFVRQGHREAGMGSELLRRLLERCGSHCAVVAPGGYGAPMKRQKRFYKRAGFGESGREGLLIYPRNKIIELVAEVDPGEA